jgi:hypothetical protein
VLSHFGDAVATGDEGAVRKAEDHAVAQPRSRPQFQKLVRSGPRDHRPAICHGVASGKEQERSKRWVDLSRFDAAPLIAFTAAKEMNYGTRKNGGI